MHQNGKKSAIPDEAQFLQNRQNHQKNQFLREPGLVKSSEHFYRGIQKSSKVGQIRNHVTLKMSIKTTSRCLCANNPQIPCSFFVMDTYAFIHK